LPRYEIRDENPRSKKENPRSENENPRSEIEICIGQSDIHVVEAVFTNTISLIEANAI